MLVTDGQSPEIQEPQSRLAHRNNGDRLWHMHIAGYKLGQLSYLVR